jgi:hypothetical protein
MKSVVLAFLGMCFSMTVIGQVRERGTVELTPNIGYTASTLYGDDIDGFDARKALQAGLLVDVFFNDRWSLRTGASFMSMGAREDGVDIVLDYLQVPINANWHFGSERKWNLNFGLSPGFLATADFGGLDVGDNLRSFQLAISYGIGYKIEVSKSFSILFDAQSVVGISNIAEADQDFKNTNSGGSLNAGAVFKL